MSKHDKSVIGVFRSFDEAQHCYDLLTTRGVQGRDVSILMSEQTHAKYQHPTTAQVVGQPKREVRLGEASKAAEGAGIGGTVGTLVGGSLAALAAIGTSLVIPGLNVVVAGPIVAALAGAGTGAVAGGVLGGLVGLGVTDDKAETYHKALHEGYTVLGVTLREGIDGKDVRSVMESCHAENIHSS